MTGPDPFREAQGDTERVRETLDAVRRDVEAVVRDEVRRSTVSRATLEAWIRDAVRREVETRRPASVVGGPVVLGLVAALLVAAGAVGYRVLAGPVTGSAPETGVVAGEPGAGAGVGPGPAGVTGAEAGPGNAPPSGAPSTANASARYDSLFRARSPLFGPLLARLEEAGAQPPVLEAVAAWRSDAPLGAGHARRLHDALVQLTLNDVAGESLVLDGLVSRGPCRGNSCGALLALWEARGPELGLPPYPEDAAADSSALAEAERALVLGRLVGSGP